MEKMDLRLSKKSYFYMDDEDVYIEFINRKKFPLDEQREKGIEEWAQIRGIKVEFLYTPNKENWELSADERMRNDINDFVERLRTTIFNQKVTFDYLEEKSGIPRATIQRYVAGKVDKLPYNRFEKICEALDHDIEEMLGIDDTIAGLEHYITKESRQKMILDVLEEFSEDLLDPDEKLILEIQRAKHMGPKDYEKVLEYVKMLEIYNSSQQND